MTTRARRGRAVLVSLGALLATRLAGGDAPAIDLSRLFADAAAWHGAADRLEGAIAEVERRSGGEWRAPADLLAALRAKDEVHGLAAEVDGYLGLREAFDAADEVAASLRPRMAVLTSRWEEEALPAFDRAVASLETTTLEQWFVAEPSLAPYRWVLGAGSRVAPRRLEPRERARNRPNGFDQPASVQAAFTACCKHILRA